MCQHDKLTYNNRFVTEHGDAWASEAIFLIGVAKALNIGEHPCLHTKLHGTCNNGLPFLATTTSAAKTRQRTW